jgi:hypothetical protein
VAAPFGFGPPSGGTYSGLRRSVIDGVTGQPVVTSAPTGRIHERAPFAPVGIDDSGRVVPAVPGFIADAPQTIASAVTLPRDAWRGEVETMPTQMSREEGQRVADLAGLAMTGSLPFRAPKGALRMFGGAAKDADDPFAALEAALAQGTKNAEPALPPGPTRVDPNAASWDLYHGSEAGPDFKRFDPHRGEAHSESGALFLASEGDTASMYAGSGPGPSGAEAGPRVFRTTVEPGRTRVFDLRDLAEDPAFRDRARRVYLDEMGTKVSPSEVRGLDRLRDGYEQNLLENFTRDREIAAQLAEMGLPPSERTGVSFGYGHIGAALQQAREEGLDTAIIRGLAEHGGEDQIAVLTPGRVRSHYDGSLLYSGGPSGLGAAAAGLLTSPSDAPAAPSQGTLPVTASPFGLGSAAMRPEDLARLFGRQPMGAAPAVAETEDEVRRLEGSIPSAPAPYGFPEVAPKAASVQPPAGSVRVPLPPKRPAGLGFDAPQADLPAEGAQPIMAPPQAVAAAPAGEEPGFMDRLMGGIQKSDGLLSHIGAGLMSNARWGDGVAAGIRSHGAAQQTKAVTDLARAKFGLEVQEAQQKAGALKGNAGLLKQAYPGMSDEQAQAQAGNGTLVTEAIRKIQNPNHGRERVQDSSGVQRWVDTGQPVFEGDQGRADKDQQKLVDVPQADGTTVKTWLKPGETSGATVGAPERSGRSNILAQADERRQLALSLGYGPETDQYKSLVATGKLPKEDQQSLTVTDKKAILEADEAVAGAKSTVGQLRQALELSKKAYTGPTASMRGYVTSLWGDEAGVATQNLDNQVTSQALENLKAIFGGAPTEGERKILLEIQGASSRAPEVRDAIYNRAIAAAERRQAFNQERADQLRGGSFYKSRPVEEVPPRTAPSGYTQPKSRADYDGLPSGSKYIAPDGSVRVKP